MTQRNRFLALAAAALAVPAILSGCAASSGASSDSDKLSVVGFSVLKTANEPVISAFQKTGAGKGVSFTTSYGASGDQSRAVAGGLHADEVHLSLQPDVQSLVDAGLVDKSWDQDATHGILTDSVVVFLVRKGNPLHIESWDDLVKPGVKVITPNPASSGSAKWNILAAWAHAEDAPGGSDAKAQEFVTKLLHNTVALPGSGSDALASFLAGNGDVLLAYENDSIEAKAAGDDVDYIVPKDTLLIENPAAVTTDASPKAQDFLDFQLSKQGQTLYAKAGFRPVISGVKTDVPGANDPSNPFPKVPHLYTIDKDFGGWDKANPEFFDDTTGIITKIIAGLNIGS
ncbi:MAG TPA: sulfate ABC transporter substrate-binding protein [Nocardioides sp.]|jgi:sulfate transport system substrate-binding protein|nr:sulfate ABC transporter substrate-binding protein [Nocardioides sp.]